jgi:hypothetical protein
VDAALGAAVVVDLELVAGGVLDVGVETKDASKLRRLRVIAEPKAEGEMPAWTDLVSPAVRNDVLRAAQLDARGRARIGPAPPGAYRLKAIAPDGAVLGEGDARIEPRGTASVTLKID